MKTIWKFRVDPVKGTGPNAHTLEVPAGARFLAANRMPSPIDTATAIDLHAGVDTEAPLSPRRVYLIETGKAVPDEPIEFLATVHLLKGAYVIHVFVEPAPVAVPEERL